MDETLEMMLRAVEGLDSPSVADRASALDSLFQELPQLSGLSAQEWEAKLKRIEDDIEDLAELADRAVAQLEQARRALETLERFAVQHGVAVRKRPKQGFLFDVVAPSDAEGEQLNRIAQAETTREAILEVMARRPQREWTPTAIADDLVRYGRGVERSNVQVTLRRLADDGQVRKVGHGAYHLSDRREGVDQSKGEAERRKAVRREAAIKAAATKRRNREAGLT